MADHLDSIGFVRILDFDWLESFISNNKKIKKDEISINGGTVKIKTCQNSTKSLLNIITYFIDQVIKQPTIEEVEILLPDDSDDTENFDKMDINEHHDSFEYSQEEEEQQQQHDQQPKEEQAEEIMERPTTSYPPIDTSKIKTLIFWVISMNMCLQIIMMLI